MVAPRCCPEAFSASATMMEASEDIVLLDPSFRAGAGAGSMRRETTKNEKTVEPISLRLLRWHQDWGDDWRHLIPNSINEESEIFHSRCFLL